MSFTGGHEAVLQRIERMAAMFQLHTGVVPTKITLPKGGVLAFSKMFQPRVPNAEVKLIHTVQTKYGNIQLEDEI
jgi:hypothetical protein